MEVVRTKGLCKTYGDKRAVDQLSMTVQKGDIYGFIGKNGAGKSTVLKMLASLAAPTAGEIELFGKPLADSVARRRVGILVESPGLYPKLSAWENMMLKATLLGLADGRKKTEKLLRLTGLLDVGKKQIKQFSMGMKQRLGIAMALLGSPDLLILDEPINGLDPEGMAQVRELLQKLNREEGITVLLSSHILGELHKMATCYGIIRDGRMVQELTARELEEKSQDYLCVRVDDPKTAAVCLEKKLHITDYEVRPEGELRIFGGCEGALLSRVFGEQKIGIQELYLHKMDLEEYFLHQMGGEEHA